MDTVLGRRTCGRDGGDVVISIAVAVAVAVAIVVVVVFVLSLSVRIITQYENGVLFWPGRVKEARGPGLTDHSRSSIA